MASPLLQHVWTLTVKDAGGASILADTQTVLGSSEFRENIVVPAGATAELDCGSIPFAKIVSLMLSCNVAVTVDTNAADGTGGQVIALAAAKGYTWNNLQPTACPITANITKIYVTNAGVKDGTFFCSFLMNQLI